MRVATYNLHAGVDGYGRATQVMASAVALHPDLLFAQEMWRGDNEDQFALLCDELGATGEFVSLGEAERVTTARGGRAWQSPLALLRGEEGLYFTERRDLTAHQRAARDGARERERGLWGMGLITTCEILDVSVEFLPQLRRDKVRRALVIAHLRDESSRFVAVGVHGAHLSHGALFQWRHVAGRLNELSATSPVVVGGDFNCWRPLLRTVLPGWRSGVVARTWPAWRAHSQIDHLLLRGSWTVSGPRAVRGPSDHKALVAELALAP